MKQAEVYQKVEKIIKDFCGKNFEVTESLSIQDGFEDSVALMEFVLTLEDEFGVEIDDDVAEEFTTVADVVTYLIEARGAQ